MTGPPPKDAGHGNLAADETDADGDFDDDSDEEFENDLVEPAREEERERRWPLAVMLAVVLGVWVGRAFYFLPDRLENLAGLALSVVTAVIAAAIYRRWVRRQFASARARRASTRARTR